LKKATKKTIVNILSFLASLEYSDSRFRNSAFRVYCLSKTALNYLVRDYAQEFAEEGFNVIAVISGVPSVAG
jgi:NAD(P)-dependent dehydrogenase (short-subunit alcohol dehydrogenase family)